MQEITILSGKGGTGKTTISAALASVANHCVFCDNDVDAADLHLILHPDIREKHTFYGAWQASIDTEKCTSCGICISQCRFEAIHLNDKADYFINPLQCEGCRLCERVCPEAAISSVRSSNNQWFVSDTRFGKFIHAKMGPGEENSGKLVTQVRNRSREIAEEINASYIINDGPPGIGCATISSLSGVDRAILVVEPSKSGLHDAARLVELVNSFKIRAYAIINKFDINQDISEKLKIFFLSKNIEVMAEIPFDRKMVESMVEGKTIVEYSPDSEISKTVKNIWNKINVA